MKKDAQSPVVRVPGFLPARKAVKRRDGGQKGSGLGAAGWGRGWGAGEPPRVRRTSLRYHCCDTSQEQPDGGPAGSSLSMCCRCSQPAWGLSPGIQPCLTRVSARGTHVHAPRHSPPPRSRRPRRAHTSRVSATGPLAAQLHARPPFQIGAHSCSAAPGKDKNAIARRPLPTPALACARRLAETEPPRSSLPCARSKIPLPCRLLLTHCLIGQESRHARSA